MNSRTIGSCWKKFTRHCHLYNAHLFSQHRIFFLKLRIVDIKMAVIPRGIVSIEYLPNYESANDLLPEDAVIPSERKTRISLETYIAYPNEQFSDIASFEENAHFHIWQIALEEFADENGIELTKKTNDAVQIIAPLFGEYQRGTLSEENLKLQIKEHDTEITVDMLPKIMECASVRKALDVIRQLHQPIANVTHETRINFCINYPLDRTATFCVKFSEELPITLLSLYYAHSAVYKEIYRLEENDIRAHFGIWGHELGDLIYNGNGNIIRCSAEPHTQRGCSNDEWIEVYLDCDS